MTVVVAALIGVAYGAGLSFCSLNVFIDDIPPRERVLIACAALTWPITIPVLFVFEELRWRYRLRKHVKNAIKREEEKSTS